eukprot:233799_1
MVSSECGPIYTIGATRLNFRPLLVSIMDWCSIDNASANMGLCLSYWPCLWCNASTNNHCIDADVYCDDKTICNGSVIWGSWAKDEDIHNCSDWISYERGMIWTATILMCVIPDVIFAIYIWFRKCKTIYRITISLTMIPFIVSFIVLTVEITKNEPSGVIGDSNLWTWWFGLFASQIISVFIVAAIIYFGMKTVRIVTIALVEGGKESVHPYCLALIYVTWWLIFFVLLGVLGYSVFSRKEVVEGLAYVSICAVFLDLWHPVNEIQNKSSDKLIKKYCGINVCDKCTCCDGVIRRCCPRIWEQHSNVNINSDHDLRLHLSENNDEIEHKEENHVHHDIVKKKECELKYWEFLGYSAWTILFISLGIIYHEYESCLLSLATFLPTFVNIFIFSKHGYFEHGKSIGCCICVFIFAFMIGLSLTIFTIWSCTCIQHDESGEWQHLAVIGTVVLFVLGHLHQKRRCMSDSAHPE